MRQVKQAFETLGKQLTGRASSLTQLTPMLVGGVEGTNIGTTVYYNHTTQDVDADFGHGRIAPGELVLVTSLGTVERYTHYTTLPLSDLKKRLGSNVSEFRLRNDACPYKSRAKLNSVVAQINNYLNTK